MQLTIQLQGTLNHTARLTADLQGPPQELLPRQRLAGWVAAAATLSIPAWRAHSRPPLLPAAAPPLVSASRRYVRVSHSTCAHADILASSGGNPGNDEKDQHHAVVPSAHHLAKPRSKSSRLVGLVSGIDCSCRCLTRMHGKNSGEPMSL